MILISARQRRVFVAHWCIKMIEPVTSFLWKAINVAHSVSLCTAVFLLDTQPFPQFSFSRWLFCSPHWIKSLCLLIFIRSHDTLPFSSRTLNYDLPNMGGKSSTDNLTEFLVNVKLTLPQSFGDYQGPLSIMLLNVSTVWGQHDDFQIRSDTKTASLRYESMAILH